MKLNNYLKTFLKRTSVIFIVLIFCFSLLEIGLRSLGRMPSNMTDGIFDQYGSSYRLKRNIKKVTNWPSFSYVTYTNSFGFRDKKVGERDLNNEPYIIFLGGSDAFANGVNYENSFVGIFAEAASKNNIDTLNIAVGGHFFEDQKTLFMEFMNDIPRKPSMIILCMNINIVSNFDKNHENTIVRNGYLFENQLWEIAYIRLVIGNLSSAYCFFRDNIRKLSARWTNFDSKFNQSFIRCFHKNNRMFDPEVVMQFEKSLDKFREYCFENHITLLFLYLPVIDGFGLNEFLIKLGENPEQYDATYHEEIVKSYCKKHKIKLINTAPILESFYDKGIQLRFKYDSHYNQYANRVVGEYLIEEMFLKKMN